jgi:hypothetical protein
MCVIIIEESSIVKITNWFQFIAEELWNKVSGNNGCLTMYKPVCMDIQRICVSTPLIFYISSINFHN